MEAFVYIFHIDFNNTFHYTGKVEEFVAPVSTDYKLQCWGAAGGGYGGRGGYAEGTYNMQSSATIYICVGGCARYYNNQIKSITSFYYGVFGGGATSITTLNRGELKNFEFFKDEVLLVAGGGGGCEWNGKGGAGGGKTGQSGSTTAIHPTVSGAVAYSYGTGGTQMAGGTYSRGNFNATLVYPAGFGVGGIGAGDDGDRGEKNDFGAQGGGGWYGGGGSVYAGAAGGGSGHINVDDPLLSDAQTIAGDEYFPSVDGEEEKGHSGHGNCVITQMGF